VVHHYASLGFVNWANQILGIESCNCEFEPLSSCFAAGSVAVGANLLRNGQLMFREEAQRPAATPQRRVRATDQPISRTAKRRATKKSPE
ncbi:MAG: hypothetical protein ACRD6N_18085, partial [Pyrinomonadaceae bacterium]